MTSNIRIVRGLCGVDGLQCQETGPNTSPNSAKPAVAGNCNSTRKGESSKAHCTIACRNALSPRKAFAGATHSTHCVGRKRCLCDGPSPQCCAQLLSFRPFEYRSMARRLSYVFILIVCTFASLCQGRPASEALLQRAITVNRGEHSVSVKLPRGKRGLQILLMGLHHEQCPMDALPCVPRKSHSKKKHARCCARAELLSRQAESFWRFEGL